MRWRRVGRLYRDGEAIVRQGEMGHCMYVVQDGEVEVVRDEGDGEVRLAVLGAGDFFGDMAMFQGEVRAATVRAVGDAHVLTVEKKVLLRRIKENPLLALELLETQSRRIQALNREVVRLRSRGERSPRERSVSGPGEDGR